MNRWYVMCDYARTLPKYKDKSEEIKKSGDFYKGKTKYGRLLAATNCLHFVLND